MEKDYLILKRASASRPSGEWNDDDFDVLASGVAVGAVPIAVRAMTREQVRSILLEHPLCWPAFQREFL
jgi:hypothetical protein